MVPFSIIFVGKFCVTIYKRREILPQLINPTQIFHKLVRKQIAYRVPLKSQIFDFQGFAIFILVFAPHLHYVIEPFKPKSRHFHILSIKTVLFMDSS